VALVAADLPGDEVITVLLKRSGGRYESLGQVLSDADGPVALPVFRPTRRGIYVIALVSSSGSVQYMKVRVS